MGIVFNHSLSTRTGSGYFKLGENYVKQACVAEEQNLQQNSPVAKRCYDQAEKALKRAGSAFKKDHSDKLGEVYLARGDIYCKQGLFEAARTQYEKSLRFEKYRDEASKRLNDLPPTASSSSIRQSLKNALLKSVCFPLKSTASTKKTAKSGDLTTLSPIFFLKNPPLSPAKRYPIATTPAEIRNTHQLAACLRAPDLSATQRELFRTLALEVIEVFADTHVKTPELMRVVAVLATIPDATIYHQLIGQTINAVNENILLEPAVLQGLMVMLCNTPEALLNAGEIRHDALADVLRVLHRRLKTVHKKADVASHTLLQTISVLLDIMVRVGFDEISRAQLQKPLDDTLKEFISNEDPAIAYQARYARQALAHIPDNESDAQEAFRRTFHLVHGALAIANMVRTLDPDRLLQIFDNFSEAFAGAGDAVHRLAGMIDGAKAMIHEAHQFIGITPMLIEAWQQRWYEALRFMDLLIGANQLTELEQFIRNSAYRHNEIFLLGLCQRLEQIACTQKDPVTRQTAANFLDDLVKNEQYWGDHDSVKRMVSAVLARLDQTNAHVYGPPVWHPDWQIPLASLSGERLLKEAKEALGKQGHSIPIPKQKNTIVNVLTGLKTLTDTLSLTPFTSFTSFKSFKSFTNVTSVA